jgi:hypothetical protein
VQKIIPTILLKKLEQLDEEACLANPVETSERVTWILVDQRATHSSIIDVFSVSTNTVNK